MKKHILTLVLLASFASFSFANVITGVAAIPENYYADLDGKKGMDNILNALCAIIDDHNVISYGGLEPYYEQTDFYADTLWDMYSTCRFYMSHANIPQKAVCDGWNKEHVVCQSWLGGGPMVSDLFNVYPTDARINNLRSNNAYGVVTGSFSGFSKDPEHHGLGKLGSGPSGAGTVYEPDDRYKGDFARTFFYMVARYRKNSLNGGDGSKMFTSNPTNLTDYSLSFLLDWHRNDPVSEKEIDRNQAVYGIQHNRNPFIDYPELVEYVWGDLVGQSVNLATMVPTCEGGGAPVLKPKYGVTWSVNGEEVLVDSVVENKRIQTMPEEPVSCSEQSEVFMGWIPSMISGTTDEKPEGLCKTLMDFPVVTENVTYYAVFAHADTSTTVEPAVYTYDEEHQEGWTTNATLSTYWLLDKGKTLVSPEIDLAGLSSIKVNMRTYGGSQYNTLDVKAGETAIAQIIATQGKTLNDYLWTNDQQLTGHSPLTFSTNYGSNIGIGVSQVIINATGSGTTYNRFITTCQSTTELQTVSDNDLPARKILVGSQIYILRNNQLFNLQGQRVQ